MTDWRSEIPNLPKESYAVSAGACYGSGREFQYAIQILTTQGPVSRIQGLRAWSFVLSKLAVTRSVMMCSYGQKKTPW